ncbi:Mitogen-activated protein kinase 16 [Linum perenne]
MHIQSVEVDFFTEYGEGSRYKIEEVIGKGSYGVVCSAYDTHTGEKVAIKKINDIFEHVSDATRILREIKLLRLLRHPDIVEIKHILLPPSRREFKDIYVVFELMESDLHQVIKANDDLTPEHYQFFLYQLLRGLKYIHTANVFHRDLKPKNILANADCKLKICDFGLARVAFNDTPTAIFWTDYVATRWYRAPELCGSFFSKVRNEKARRYLSSMRKKKPIPFTHKFPNADPLALRLLEKMLAFEPKDRPTAEEALADPYFRGLAKVEREPAAQPVTKMEFEFERRRITKEDVRELIYRETLEYHPKMLKEFLEGSEPTGFMYPSAVDHFKKQFAHLEEHYGTGTPPERQHASSLPRACVLYSDNRVQSSAQVTNDLAKCSIKDIEKPQMDRSGGVPMTRLPIQVPQSIQGPARPGKVVGSVLRYNNCATASDTVDQRRMIRNPSATTQYTSANGSYPRTNASCKNERGEDEGIERPVGLQPKPQYMARKVSTAQGGPGSQWYG